MPAQRLISLVLSRLQVREIRERTGTIDTRDLAVLTALNLARELMDARKTGFAATDRSLMRELIELAEAEVEASVADA